MEHITFFYIYFFSSFFMEHITTCYIYCIINYFHYLSLPQWFSAWTIFLIYILFHYDLLYVNSLIKLFVLHSLFICTSVLIKMCQKITPYFSLIFKGIRNSLCISFLKFEKMTQCKIQQKI